MTSLVQNSLLMAEEGAHVDAPKHRPEGAIASSAVVTLVLWTSCVLVGIIGVLVPYARPTEPVIAPPAIQAELIEVQLSNEPLPDVPALLAQLQSNEDKVEGENDDRGKSDGHMVDSGSLVEAGQRKSPER